MNRFHPNKRMQSDAAEPRRGCERYAVIPESENF
jgi:hypothetical protein